MKKLHAASGQAEADLRLQGLEILSKVFKSVEIVEIVFPSSAMACSQLQTSSSVTTYCNYL